MQLETEWKLICDTGKMAQIPSPSPSPTTGFPTIMHNPHSILMPGDRSKILQNIICGRGYSGYYINAYPPFPSAYHTCFMDPNDPFRPRSGSLQSIGSTASTYRPERSPSRESTSSHDSLVMRASPISLPEESPSPSPPTEGTDSKLLNILKGNVQSPFSSLFAERRSEIQSNHHPEIQPLSQQTSVQQQPNMYYYHQKSPSTVRKSATHSISKKQALFNEPALYSSRHEPYLCSKRQPSYPVGSGNRSNNDFPIDLSSKPKRSKLETAMPRRYTMPAETFNTAAMAKARIAARTGGSRKAEATIVRPQDIATKTSQSDFLEPVSPPPRVSSLGSVQTTEELSGSDHSILRSILNGNSSPVNGLSGSPSFGIPKTSYPSPINGREVMSAPASPATSSFSESSSPLSMFNFSRGSTSPCDQNAVVTIAKKTVYPVRARVKDWVQKSVQFAKSLREFSSLSDGDQLLLMHNAIARVLLVYMAENHFQFAVTPGLPELEENFANPNNTGQETPTRKSVDKIQGFIKRCQRYNLDATEYDHIKTALIFDTGVSQISNREQVDTGKARSREELREYVCKSHGLEPVRYSNILLLLHTLSGINSEMVQNLFCKHVLDGGSMRDYIKELLLK